MEDPVPVLQRGSATIGPDVSRLEVDPPVVQQFALRLPLRPNRSEPRRWPSWDKRTRRSSRGRATRSGTPLRYSERSAAPSTEVPRV